MNDLSNLDFSQPAPQQPAFKGKSAFDYLATSASSSRSVSPQPRPSPALLSNASPSTQDAFAGLFEAKPKDAQLPMSQRLPAQSPLFGS
jgi:hypothetical protein